jgi:hypothetical protein
VFTPGDFGLAIWADSRLDNRATSRLLEAVRDRLWNERYLARLPGMEIAWLLIGLSEAVRTGTSDERDLCHLLNHLRRQRRAESGLFYHHGHAGVRRHLPNFATEIYTLLALSLLSRYGIDASCLTEATQLGDHLLRLQRPDGGWPWLYHADRAIVVEDYELYSVHQDAMAPMALLELSAVTKNPKYSDAALAGLAWSRGRNDLGFDLLDEDAGFAHRSIRRLRPWNRVIPALNSAVALARRHPIGAAGLGLEVNRTCRSYHLGWILEAWAGRVPVSADQPGGPTTGSGDDTA